MREYYNYLQYKLWWGSLYNGLCLYNARVDMIGWEEELLSDTAPVYYSLDTVKAVT